MRSFYKIKTTYLLGSLLLLSSCSQEEAPAGRGAGGERVIFRTALPTLSTRAEILKDTTLSYFQVTAFNPSNNKLVSGVKLNEHFKNQRIDIAEGGSQHSSDSCIWPEAGMESHEVTFFAFYPELHDGAGLENNTTVAGTTANYNYKLTDFHVNPQIGEQVDFITAYTTGNMADNLFSGIMLPFYHQLSRIEVKAWSDNKSCDIEIAGVRIGGVGVKGTFAFKPTESGGEWDGAPSERGIVEYIFKEGDEIVRLAKGAAETSSKDGAVSIMGSKIGDEENCAMLIPYNYATGWNIAADRKNTAKNMYISVLLRVDDATDTAGINPENRQRYPYTDLSQGKDALTIPRVYLAVNKETGKVSQRVYKDGESYYSDEDGTTEYEIKESEEIKEFGWAALPVKGNWAPGNIYTYTLDYTSGVGLHDPEVATASPAAGDPIISDKVGFSYEVKGWNEGGGSEFVVPGS